jgi:molybdopterin-guanine dinucleotide biosynthesis protein A
MTRQGAGTPGISGFVLAGGASSRFGRDKALVQLAGKPLLIRICELVEASAGSVCIVAPSGRYAEFHFPIVDDRWPDQGPLGGIITALRATADTGGASEWNLMVSCDMPFLTRDWLSYMVERALASNAEVIVPRSEYGLEPLCACWRTSIAPALQAAFNDGVRKVTEAMKRLRMEVLDETHWKRFDSAGRLFWNMNTPQDYQAALQIWESEKS